MPVVVPPLYTPNRTFAFSTHEGLRVEIALDSRLTGTPDPVLPVRTADNPLILNLQTFDEGYSPIIALSAELRFLWDANTNLGTFLRATTHSTGYPYWRAIIRVYDPSANLIFQRLFQPPGQ